MKPKSKQLLTYLAIAFTLFIISVVGLVAWIIFQANYWQLTRGGPLEQDLGFHHGSPYIRIGPHKVIEVMTLENLDPSGPLAQAGAKEGDIPLGGLSITGFFKMLDTSRGEQVTIILVAGGDGPPLNEREHRAVTFTVPVDKMRRGTEPGS